MMAELPAIHASVNACNQALALLQKQVPLFEYLDVVSLNGDLRCSSQPFTHTVNMADRGWFQQVFTTRKFAVEVVSKRKMTSHALLVLSAPYFDTQGKLAGMLNMGISAASLQPSSDNLLLAHATELAAFSRDGTVLMRSPQADGLLDSDQSRSALFKLLASETKPINRSLAGIDGVQRLYALQHFTSGKPGNVVYLAAGVDQSFLRHFVLLPLLRNLAIIALIALNTLPGIFFVLDDQGRFLRWNRRFEDVTGYSMEELKLRSFSEVTPPELRERFSAVFRRALTGMRMEGEFEMRCHDGARIPYYCVTDRLQAQGQISVVVVGVDISERKQAEQRVNMFLEELQQLSARLLAVQEEERRGIARELHDEFGQGLTAALLNLKELTTQAGPGMSASQVQQVAVILTELTQQVRTLSLNLRPSVLDDLGLAAAVRWYIRERVEPAGLRVTLDMDKSLPRLTTLIETTCFRVLQGVLTNVMRHAHAKHVQVGLHLADGVLTLTVHDDGCGFEVQQARRDAVSGKSLGLLGMEERVRLAGGKFSISSSPGQGTKVRVTLPTA